MDRQSTEDFEDSETPHDTIMVGTCHYKFVQNHKCTTKTDHINYGPWLVVVHEGVGEEGELMRELCTVSFIFLGT